VVVLTAVARAVRDFEVWSEAGGQPGDRPEICVDCLEALLEGRATYLGAKDPTRWRRGDVRALLYELAVPRLSEQCDLSAHTVPAVDAYLEFLDRTERLHPGSAAVRYLRQELAQQAGGFPAAMADRSRFRMAKTLYRAMLADGVDIGDDQAVDDWTARFNQVPQAERAAVLEYLLIDKPELATARFAARAGKVASLPPGQENFDSRRLLPREQREPEVAPAFDPVDVPSRAEAAVAARRSGLLADLLTLARWLGQGRKVTKNGEPVPADVRALGELFQQGPQAAKAGHLHQVPGLQVLFWLAWQVELVELRHTGLVAGPGLAAWRRDDALATADDEQVLDLWLEVFLLVEFGLVVPEEARTGKNAENAATFLAARGCTPGMMVGLYRAAARDQDQLVVDLITPHREHLMQALRRTRWDVEEAELVDVSLRFVLALPLGQLIEHGALQLRGPGSESLATAPRAATGGLTVRTVLLASSDRIRTLLTPLGRWAMREALLAEGAEVPAAELLAGRAGAGSGR
jgi:hypothetical protein